MHILSGIAGVGAEVLFSGTGGPLPISTSRARCKGMILTLTLMQEWAIEGKDSSQSQSLSVAVRRKAMSVIAARDGAML